MSGCTVAQSLRWGVARVGLVFSSPLAQLSLLPLLLKTFLPGAVCSGRFGLDAGNLSFERRRHWVVVGLKLEFNSKFLKK